MTKIIWTLRFLMFISFIFLFLILVFSSPYKGNIISEKDIFNIGIFFLFFFLTFFSFFSLFLYRFRRRKLKFQNEYSRNANTKIFKISLRHGCLLSSGLTLVLVFQSFRILTWWMALLLGSALLLIELYFLSERD